MTPALDHYNGRKVIAISPSLDRTEYDWQFDLEGGACIRVHNSSMKEPFWAVGWHLATVTMSADDTTLVFQDRDGNDPDAQTRTVTLEPVNYSIWDAAVSNDPVFPQRSDYVYGADEKEEEVVEDGN